jgi:UDPglucose 6-dehydrogenase
MDIVAAVDESNERQKRILFSKLERHFAGQLSGRTIAVWGLAFKAETDDMRESPSIVLIEQLLEAGARPQVHDPAALETARRLFGDRLTYTPRAYDALTGADALVIVTEWLEYRTPDFEKIRQALKRPLIVDGRNLYEPARVARLGFTYDSIGRPCASL